MICPTQYSISDDLLHQAAMHIPDTEFKLTINEPTGKFFYDPWQVKEEFNNTVWSEILKTLPVPHGEARLIKLKPGQSYQSHADIDDRYHLNISGNNCFIIDLSAIQMFPLLNNGIWYDMDAGDKHTATNFGNRDRYQLVVRKLLNSPLASLNLISVKIESEISDLEDARFYFDNTVSKFLNQLNKSKMIGNFEYSTSQVSFDIPADFLDALKTVCGDYFHVRVV